ncbi:MAG: hypothetical protein KPEEDBHJ_02247 [Anaerolineales bacterium]|nr:hypothetical protein [Anaerolineales bacterium]
MSKKTIEKNLVKALLQDGAMTHKLFEFELEEHVDEFLKSKKKDKDDYFFAVTEHTNDVAMLLIDEKNRVHINEDARAKLKEYWSDSYEHNLKVMISHMADELSRGFLSVNGVKIDKRTSKTTKPLAGDKPRCGLCGKTKNLTKTECCGNWICDDQDKYVLFSYAHNSCSRNHGRYTLCSYHFNEGHSGGWKTCKKCKNDFETEMYVYYGTNEYNFEKLQNPPEFKPTRCAKCKKVIRLGTDGYSMHAGKYYCMECSALKW